jgi:hypothetical protein
VALLLGVQASEMSTNVTSVEPVQRINPELAVSPDRVDMVSAAQAGVPVRRLTRLDADYYAAHDSVPTRSIPRPRAETTPPRPDQPWLRMLERAVGGWAPTLRGSLAVLGVFVCATILMVMALGPGAFGIAGAILVVGICLNASGKLPRA